MTVKEVIEKLGEYPPDAHVFVEGRRGDMELNKCQYDKDGLTLGSGFGKCNDKGWQNV